MAFNADERLYLGAEAEVWRGSWMGLPAVRKQRRLRSWRHPDLDDRLGRRRMIAEARLMVRLYRSGLNIPVLYDCDIKEQQLVMSNIPGRPLIELLNDASIDDQRIREHLLAPWPKHSIASSSSNCTWRPFDQQHHDDARG